MTMSISGIQTSTTPVVGAADRDYTQMTDLDFMNLLVAQIQNQDPLSPMSNAEFTSQITQFSMLEQIAGLGNKMDQQVLMSQAINNTAMLSLIGRDVTVAGDQVTVDDGEVSPNMLNAAAAGTATVEVLDSTGAVIRTYEVRVNAGLNEISWDGKQADDSQAPNGEYKLRVKVKNPEGEEVVSAVLMTAAVEGLRFENNAAIVTVNGKDFQVADIFKVS
jgi:flagellar basal-body rod modification protein FlgD